MIFTVDSMTTSQRELQHLLQPYSTWLRTATSVITPTCGKWYGSRGVWLSPNTHTRQNWAHTNNYLDKSLTVGQFEIHTTKYLSFSDWYLSWFCADFIWPRFKHTYTLKRPLSSDLHVQLCRYGGQDRVILHIQVNNRVGTVQMQTFSYSKNRKSDKGYWSTHSVMLDCGSGPHTGSSRLWDRRGFQYQFHIVWGRNKSKHIFIYFITWQSLASKPGFTLWTIRSVSLLTLFCVQHFAVLYCSRNPSDEELRAHLPVRNSTVSNPSLFFCQTGFVCSHCWGNEILLRVKWPVYGSYSI